MTEDFNDEAEDYAADAVMEALEEQYHSIRPRYEILAKKLENLLRGDLLKGKIDNYTVVSRAKDVGHFMEKVTREGKNYSDPLRQVTDLAGVRIVVGSLSDVEVVADLLAEEFEIDRVNSVDKRSELHPDQFGYLSQHYVVRLKGDRSNVTEWRNLRELWAEIQVRTVLQDAWAQVDHSLIYKAENDIPDEIKRRLNAVSALLEVADRELDALIDQTRNRLESIQEKIEQSRGDVPLDAESFMAYLQHSSIIEYWVGVARGIGLKVTSVDNISEDIRLYSLADLQRIADIDRVMSEAKGWGEAFIKCQFEAWHRDHQERLGVILPWPPSVEPKINTIVMLIVFASFPQVYTKEVLAKEFPADSAERVVECARVTNPRFGIGSP